MNPHTRYRWLARPYPVGATPHYISHPYLDTLPGPVKQMQRPGISFWMLLAVGLRIYFNHDTGFQYALN